MHQVTSKDLRDEEDGLIISFQIGDAVDLATVVSDHYRKYALNQLRELVAQNNISWIQIGDAKGVFDLQFLAQEFSTPDLKSLNWFKGIISIRPEFSFLENQVVGHQKYQTVIQFSITANLVNVPDANLERLNEAYRIISYIELSLRDLIEAKLRIMHNDGWWKSGVPEQVRIDCEQRKKDKEKPGEVDHHPINYAYVDNYKTIIIKRDNWDTVFAAVLNGKIKVEASFSWVANVRDAVAHARPIADDDYKMFVASASWLQSAIDKA